MRRLIAIVMMLGAISASRAETISQAHNAFGFNCTRELAKGEKGKNVFISPTSIALALSMVYNGAEGETKEGMGKTLQFDSMDVAAVNEQSQKLTDGLKNTSDGVEIAIANSVWARKGVDFKKNFLDTVTKYFGAEISTVDFGDPATVGTINSWVSKNTRNKITSIVNPPIPRDMVMYLINAVYFKGSWTKAFEKALTKERDFTTGDGASKKVPMMQRKAKLLYLETADFQSVSLPYGKERRLSMRIFLPKNIDEFVQQLDGKKWNEWMEQYDDVEGTILLPKFKMEYEKELKDLLTTLGMGAAFEDSADLSGIGNGLKISKVKHKTYVDVNEEGTEAAAVTSIGIALSAARVEKKPFYMEVNRPFFFAIVDSQTNEALFMGVVRNP